MSNAKIPSTPYAPFKARWVQGSPFALNTNNHLQQPEPDTSKHHWYMAFAIPKGPAWDDLWATMYNAAANDPRCGAALCGQAGFGWKFEDCDAPNNPENLGKDSHPAGHYLLKFKRNIAMEAIPVVDGAFNPIINETAIKRGDYFIIDGATVFNGAATIGTNAGMYQNINGIMFAEAGEAIISEGSFDPRSAFAGFTGGMVVNGSTPQAGAPIAASVGAAPTPPPAAGAQVTPPPVAGAQVTPPPVAGAQVTPPPVAAGAPVTPATDLTQPGHAGAAPTPPPAAVAAPTPPPAAAAVEKSYNVNGQVFTRSALVAAGYTDAHFATLKAV